jgi:hypothetical protein
MRSNADSLATIYSTSNMNSEVTSKLNICLQQSLTSGNKNINLWLEAKAGNRVPVDIITEFLRHNKENASIGLAIKNFDEYESPNDLEVLAQEIGEKESFVFSDSEPLLTVEGYKTLSPNTEVQYKAVKVENLSTGVAANNLVGFFDENKNISTLIFQNRDANDEELYRVFTALSSTDTVSTFAIFTPVLGNKAKESFSKFFANNAETLEQFVIPYGGSDGSYADAIKDGLLEYRRANYEKEPKALTNLKFLSFGNLAGVNLDSLCEYFEFLKNSGVKTELTRVEFINAIEDSDLENIGKIAKTTSASYLNISLINTNLVNPNPEDFTKIWQDTNLNKATLNLSGNQLLNNLNLVKFLSGLKGELHELNVDFSGCRIPFKSVVHFLSHIYILQGAALNGSTTINTSNFEGLTLQFGKEYTESEARIIHNMSTNLSRKSAEKNIKVETQVDIAQNKAIFQDIKNTLLVVLPSYYKCKLEAIRDTINRE